MHSPKVLVFSVRSFIPRRDRLAKVNSRRWQLPFRHVRGLQFRYSPFMVLAGRGFYFEDWLQVWHYEPGGKDAFTVCRDRYKNKNGEWEYTNRWKLHFWHWKLSPSLLYKWRRRIFTRCSECGGPSRKGSVVNVSDGGWGGGPKVPIWCGEVRLYHSKCLSKKNKRHHNHDPKGCYSCSGQSSFEYNRNKRANKELAKRFAWDFNSDSLREQ